MNAHRLTIPPLALLSFYFLTLCTPFAKKLFSESRNYHLQLSTIYQYEDFSFSSRGMNGTIDGNWTIPEKINLSLTQETVHRFEKTETLTALWAQRHFKRKNNKHRVNAGFSTSPKFKNSGEKILPQWKSSLGYGFLPHKKMVLDLDTKFANYDAANNYSFGMASEWYPFTMGHALSRLYFLLRWRLTATDFFEGSAWVWNHSVSVQPVIELLPERLNLSFLYGFSREPFEAGAPGEIRSFQSDLFHLGLLYRKKQFKLRGGFDYESRSNSSFVRRWTFSFSQEW